MNHKHSVMMRTCWCLCLILLGLPLQAQSVLRGRVEDEQQNGVADAAVRVLTADSAFVKGAASHSDGAFAVAGLPAGRYILSVSCIGYAGRSLNFEMPASDYALPPVVLKEDSAMLKGVTVTGSAFIRKKDRVLIIPDNLQKKHSYTGYDLLYNLMIPGVAVDRREGKVTTSRGEATLYINGVKADYREVRNLRPKDIERVEYIDVPTKEYLGDVAAVNYITKEYKTGGYVSLDGEQNIGYLKGDYNVGAKVSHGDTDYLLFGGYNMRRYDGKSTSKSEEFRFDDRTVRRNGATEDAAYRNDQQYAQFGVKNNTKKRQLTGYVSFVHDHTPHDDQSESLSYLDGSGTSTLRSAEAVRQESYKPALSLNGGFHLGDSQRLRIRLNTSYLRNEYQRDYSEQDRLYHTNVKENLYSFSVVGIYIIQLKHNNSFGASLQHYHTITSSDYTGDTRSSQYMWMGESMAFVNYTQSVGKFLFVEEPGVSMLNYKLNHSAEDRHRFWTFRTNTWMRYQFNPKHQVELGFAIGNEEAELSYLSGASQIVDSLTVKRGNPDLKNTKIYIYFFQYLAQIGRANMEFHIDYTTYPHNISSDYYTENGKLVSSYTSDGSFHDLRLTYLCSWRLSDNLRANTTLRYTRMSVPRHAEWKENNFFASLDVNYFIKSFALNAYVRTTETKLDQTTLARVRTPASCGFSVRYSGGNWMAEAGTENPFTRHQHYREYGEYGVYRYDQVRTSRIYQQTAYVKLAYTFNFGKKTSRENSNVDRSINSAILKAE